MFPAASKAIALAESESLPPKECESIRMPDGSSLTSHASLLASVLVAPAAKALPAESEATAVQVWARSSKPAEKAMALPSGWSLITRHRNCVFEVAAINALPAESTAIAFVQARPGRSIE